MRAWLISARARQAGACGPGRRSWSWPGAIVRRGERAPGTAPTPGQRPSMGCQAGQSPNAGAVLGRLYLYADPAGMMSHSARRGRNVGTSSRSRSAARPTPVPLGMRLRGLEPPRGFPHTDLNRARLPISPQPRGGWKVASGGVAVESSPGHPCFSWRSGVVGWSPCLARGDRRRPATVSSGTIPLR